MHTYRFGEDQRVLHESCQLRGRRGDVEKVSCSDTSVDWMIEHSEGDAIEAHHICQHAAISLCREGGKINPLLAMTEQHK